MSHSSPSWHSGRLPLSSGAPRRACQAFRREIPAYARSRKKNSSSASHQHRHHGAFRSCRLIARPRSKGAALRAAPARVGRLSSQKQRKHGDGELDINPLTPCQIGKRPPAPKPKRESAGHKGVAGGGYQKQRKHTHTNDTPGRGVVFR